MWMYLFQADGPVSAQESTAGFGSAKFVLILGCDGLGADYLIQANVSAFLYASI